MNRITRSRVKIETWLRLYTFTARCPICGNIVEPNKYAVNKIYCSNSCRLYAQHMRYANTKRKTERAKVALTGRAKPSRGNLSDLTVIVIDGKERIRSAVQLQYILSRKRRHA